MIRLDEVRERIGLKVPELDGRLGNAGQFTQVIENNQLPQQDLGGFVLPGSLAGGAHDTMTGQFIQNFAETVIVVLVIRYAGDVLGERAIDQLPPLVSSVIGGVVGWGPDDAPGVFVLGSAELVGSKDGAVIYHIEFTLQDQMRIIP